MGELVFLVDEKMKTLLQINPVLRVSTSTGRIMQEIGEQAWQHGWKSYVAYSRGRDGLKPCRSHVVPVGSRWSVFWHGVATRLFDRHGLASSRATRSLIRQIEAVAPDIIHLHNIHGYFLNYRLLFRYLSRCGIPVVWTVHDCWLYTGHCYYYTFARCGKWQSGCHHCPQKKRFPASFFVDRSARNYADKRAAFTSMPRNRLTLVPVSEWMKGEMQRSFLREYDFRVIRNGIDTDVFCPCEPEAVKRRLHLQGKRLLLGVASVWSREKGFDDFVRLAAMLNPEERIVLIGLKPEEQKGLPGNVIGVARTENVHQLAEFYSAADAFLNLTWQDNYPTVNMEALACGTPVVAYRTGGNVEALTRQTGFAVEPGDLEGVLRAVRAIEQKGKACYRGLCREHALAHFRKEDRYADYLELYDGLLRRDDGQR